MGTFGVGILYIVTMTTIQEDAQEKCEKEREKAIEIWHFWFLCRASVIALAFHRKVFILVALTHTHITPLNELRYYFSSSCISMCKSTLKKATRKNYSIVDIRKHRFSHFIGPTGEKRHIKWSNRCNQPDDTINEVQRSQAVMAQQQTATTSMQNIVSSRRRYYIRHHRKKSPEITVRRFRRKHAACVSVGTFCLSSTVEIPFCELREWKKESFFDLNRAQVYFFSVSIMKPWHRFR